MKCSTTRSIQNPNIGLVIMKIRQFLAKQHCVWCLLNLHYSCVANWHESGYCEVESTSLLGGYDFMFHICREIRRLHCIIPYTKVNA